MTTYTSSELHTALITGTLEWPACSTPEFWLRDLLTTVLVEENEAVNGTDYKLTDCEMNHWTVTNPCNWSTVDPWGVGVCYEYSRLTGSFAAVKLPNGDTFEVVTTLTLLGKAIETARKIVIENE